MYTAHAPPLMSNAVTVRALILPLKKKNAADQEKWQLMCETNQ